MLRLGSLSSGDSLLTMSRWDIMSLVAVMYLCVFICPSMSVRACSNIKMLTTFKGATFCFLFVINISDLFNQSRRIQYLSIHLTISILERQLIFSLSFLAPSRAQGVVHPSVCYGEGDELSRALSSSSFSLRYVSCVLKLDTSIDG